MRGLCNKSQPQISSFFLDYGLFRQFSGLIKYLMAVFSET